MNKIPNHYYKDTEIKGFVKNSGVFCEQQENNWDEVRIACIDINQIDSDYGSKLKKLWHKLIDSSYKTKNGKYIEHYYNKLIFQEICDLISNYQSSK